MMTVKLPGPQMPVINRMEQFQETKEVQRICRMELIRRRPVMLRQKKRDLRMALVKRMLLTVQPVMTQQMKRQTMKPVKTQEMKQQTMKQARMRRKISQTGRRS